MAEPKAHAITLKGEAHQQAARTGGSWQVVWSATVAVALLTLINGGYRRALEVLYVSELELMPHRHTTID